MGPSTSHEAVGILMQPANTISKSFLWMHVHPDEPVYVFDTQVHTYIYIDMTYTYIYFHMYVHIYLFLCSHSHIFSGTAKYIYIHIHICVLVHILSHLHEATDQRKIPDDFCTYTILFSEIWAALKSGMP